MGRRTISIYEKKKACSLYESGIPVRDISGKLNMSQATIMSILKYYGIPLRGGKKITKSQESLVVGLYEKGYSILDIIAKTGVKSEQTIYRILRDADVKRRRNT